jgi:hypothetical protein
MAARVGIGWELLLLARSCHNRHALSARDDPGPGER